MGKSQADVLLLWMYSGYSCGVIALHNVLTTPFGVLNPEKAIIVIGTDVAHSLNVCACGFMCAGRQITADVYELNTAE